MAYFSKSPPPYLNTCSNCLRAGSVIDEDLFTNWSTSRNLIYSNNFFTDHSCIHPCINDDLMKKYKNLFLFPWECCIAKEEYLIDNIQCAIPSELKPLVEAELADRNRTKDELASSLLDILGPEYFELIDKLCSPKNKVITLPQSSKKGVLNTPSIPGIYSRLLAETAGQMVRHSVALPHGTIHECIPGREYFCFPAKNSSTDFWHGLAELDISSAFPHPLLAAGGKKLFPYSKLNKMQSVVFPVAFNSNENMLVCAPTGAGKTDVALTAILRVIWENCHIEAIDDLKSSLTLKVDRNAFKIIYIAPMKALATEIATKYQMRLAALKIVVREYTGDMRLSYKELDEANILVSTPEKWDVLTRNPSFADSVLGIAVKLIIIDEVHLLQDSRGAVLETLVARTLRYVERAQRIVRIIGLSATLPNFMDVAEWLRASVKKGLFFFDSSFRPVPLKVTLIGLAPTIRPQTEAIPEAEKDQSKLTTRKSRPSKVNINQLLDSELIDGIRPVLLDHHQALIFVHGRSETLRVARLLAGVFGPVGLLWKLDICPKVELNSLRQLLGASTGAIGIHHAGMCRPDRLIVEGLFKARHLSLLVCTSTLAWGVNLPARAVFIRGTDVFKSSQSNGEGGFWSDLSALDVLQIFGRAGRPGLDDAGEATLLCSSSSLPKYLLSLSPTNAIPIESTFSTNLDTHLNAEINLGTVRSIDDGMSWLSYTFLWVRTLHKGSRGLRSLEGILRSSVDRLVSTGLCTKIPKINTNQFELLPTELGEITSRLYLSVATVNSFCKKLREISVALTHLSPKKIITFLIKMFSEASEFTDSIKIRSASGNDLEEEGLLRMLLGPKLWLQRLDLEPSKGHFNFSGSWSSSSVEQSSSSLVPFFDILSADWTSSATKVSILFQAYVSGWENSTISSSNKGYRVSKEASGHKYDIPDLHYIILNAGRFLRAIFEISLKVIKNLALSTIALDLCKCFENRTWSSHYLAERIYWNTSSLLKQAGSKNSTDFIAKVDEQFTIQAQCHGWSRSSPLQLALFSAFENSTDASYLNGIPLLSLKNLQSHVIQIVKDKIILELYWSIICHSIRHDEEYLRAVISFPHNSEVLWNDNFTLSKNQQILNCKISLSISLLSFPNQKLPLELNLSILNEFRLGLDVENVPILLGQFINDQDDEINSNFTTSFVNPISLRRSLPPECFLLGRGKVSLLFPVIPRPFLEVSKLCKSFSLQSYLYSQNVYSFSAIQSILAKPLLNPFTIENNIATWCNGKNLIAILAPPNSGKKLTLELAIWGVINSNQKAKVLVLVPDLTTSTRLLKLWSSQNSILGILGITPSTSLSDSVVILNPSDILRLNSIDFCSTFNSPLLIISTDIELIGDNPDFEMSLTLLRYWTHCNTLCRWMVFGRPFMSATDMLSWLNFDTIDSNTQDISELVHLKPNVWSLFCGPEVTLSPLPLITTRVTSKMPGAIASEISKAISPNTLLVVWVYSRRFCRILSSKLSVLLAQNQIGFNDETIFSFNDELLNRTISQSGVAFWISSEKDALLYSSSFIKILVIAVPSSYSAGSNIFTIPHKVASTRMIDCIIVLPHLQKSISIDSTLYYSSNQLSQMISVARNFSPDKRPSAILMGSSDQCLIASSFILSDNGYKLPIESRLLSLMNDENDHSNQKFIINTSLMSAVLCSRQLNLPDDFTIPVSEIESFFEWSFLFRRLKSNPSYYGWQDLACLVRETLLSLDTCGAISYKKNSDYITILPHCRLSAFYSLNAFTITKLDKELVRLWKNKDDEPNI